MDYKDFAEVFDNTIFHNAKINLIEKRAHKPQRYIGIFRSTKPKGKIMHNLLQSHEIRFGNAFEKVIERLLIDAGYKMLEQKIKHKGKNLHLDHIFSKGDKLFFIEQKIRDDHDSSKIRGQVNNLDKKIQAITKKYPAKKITGFMHFIDDSFPQSHFQSIEPLETMAEHMAMAHLDIKEVDENYPSYADFLREQKDNVSVMKHFIKFWGIAISRTNFADNRFGKKRTIKMWEHMLKTYEGADSPLVEFGNFMNCKSNNLDLVWLAKMMAKTLKKTKGKLDIYYHLENHIEEMANLDAACVYALEIIELVFLSSVPNNVLGYNGLETRKKWKSAFKALYKNNKTKAKAKKLREDLVKKYLWFYDSDY